MIGIFKITDNPFDSRLIRTDRLATFGADAATRLATDHPELSGPIRAAVDRLTGTLGKVEVERSQRRYDTRNTDDFLDEVAGFMEEHKDQLSVSFKRNSAAFLALYPNGIQTYTRLRKSEAPARFDVLKQIMDDQGASVPDEIRNRIAGFAAAWKSLREGQDGSEGALANTRGSRDEARAELEDALYVALLDLSKIYRSTPVKVRAFFDHTLLATPRHASLERQPVAAAN